MKTVKIISLILAMSVLSIQSVRHIYCKYFEVTSSAIDKYDKPLKKELEQARSLDEIVAKYAPARERKDVLDAQMKAEAQKLPPKERSDFREEFQKAHEVDYRNESDIRGAIEQWEARTNEIRELRVFWLFGLGLFVLGCFVYLKSPWLGMAFLIPGVLEMIWWSSPSFTWGGTVQEYERLLTNRLVLTVLTLIPVVAAWLIHEWLERRKCRKQAS
jgi:hypothetical protein